jgi:hypothetical protein
MRGANEQALSITGDQMAGSSDGDSYKSWSWWLDALEAMRRTYSIPMDAREAKIRADVDDARWKECRAAAAEARRRDRPAEEEAAVMKWAATGDPEATAYRRTGGGCARSSTRCCRRGRPSSEVPTRSGPTGRPSWRAKPAISGTMFGPTNVEPTRTQVR